MNTSSISEEEPRGPASTLDCGPVDVQRDLDAVVPTAHAQLDLNMLGDVENDLYDTKSKRNFNSLFVNGTYWVTQKLPHMYTANHATFPI